MLTKSGQFWTTDLSGLANVVCERPLIKSTTGAIIGMLTLESTQSYLHVQQLKCPKPRSNNKQTNKQVFVSLCATAVPNYAYKYTISMLRVLLAPLLS